MTDRMDHVAEAQKHIEWAHEQQEREGDMGNVPRDNALLAQVHATLALVEQQRIANIIAYWQLHTPRSTEEEGFIEVRVLLTDGDNIDNVVREGLGL